MSERSVARSGPLRGSAVVPGDKSISHRYAMLAAVASGVSRIRGFSTSADCQSTLNCLRQWGVQIDLDPAGSVRVSGRGLSGLREPSATLDAGNSGTTVRLLAGLAAGQLFPTTFTGDESLSRRPMRRVAEPLGRMGAVTSLRQDQFLPMTVTGAPLRGIDHVLEVASAQVKSAILLAGLYAHGTTRVREPGISRDHTERAFAQFGAAVAREQDTVSVTGGRELAPQELTVPGDFSSAAFLVAATLLTPGSSVTIREVGLNPTRTAFLDVIRDMGAAVRVDLRKTSPGGEPVGDIEVAASGLRTCVVPVERIPNLIDEIPVLAVLGARCEGGLKISGARELRVKESDRIRAIVTNLRELGVEAGEFDDGFFVPPTSSFRPGIVDSFGDHRIAMAFAIAGLAADGPVVIQNSECVGISFPGFFATLDQLRA